MAISKKAKSEALDAISKGLSNAASAVFVSFDRLSVFDTNAMRRKLESENVSYKVVKKTLLAKALETTSVTGTMPQLNGNIAIAWSSVDAVAPAREIFNFRKGHEEQLNLLGGIFENSFKDAAGINEIATIPSMQALRGMFVNLINSPRQRFAVVLSEYAKK